MALNQAQRFADVTVKQLPFATLVHTRCRLLPAFLVAMLSIVSCDNVWADEPGEELDAIPLHLRLPWQHILVIADNELELNAIKTALEDQNVKYEVASSYDKNRVDYDDVFAIIAGSHMMKYFKKETDPEAFQHIDRFIKKGGHLFQFGVFNGAYCENFNQYGIITSHQHSGALAHVPNHTEVLFNGFEDKIPKDLSARQVGNFQIDAPHISMLKRGPGHRLPGHTALFTLPVGRGRISSTMITPYEHDNIWIVPIVTTWVARGAPTIREQLEQSPVVDPVTLQQDHRTSSSVMPKRLFETLTKSLSESFSAEKNSAGKLASQILKAADSESGKQKKFCLLRMAADQFAEQANADAAIAALLAAAQLYQIDLIPEKLRLLQVAFLATADPEEANEIARLALDYCEEAENLSHFDQAWKLAVLARDASTRANNDHFQQLSRLAVKRLTPVHLAWEKVSTAFREIKATPDDPELNTIVGKFMAFVAEDWNVGLTCLALGSDENLRDLAKLSQSLPDTPLERMRLLDRWSTLARELDGEERFAVERQVRQWYRDVHNELSTLSRIDQNRVREAMNRTHFVPAQLRIKLRLDGYGRLTIQNDRMIWNTSAGREPQEIAVNLQSWDLIKQKSLLNRGSTRFLPDNVDLQSIRVRKVKGRGVERLIEASEEKVVIRISDVPKGEADYEMLVTFTGDKQ